LKGLTEEKHDYTGFYGNITLNIKNLRTKSW